MKCPFKSVVIEGVPQKITSNVVHVKGTPSGWSGGFRWLPAVDTTAELYADRIMRALRATPERPSSSTPGSRTLAALGQTGGFSTPGYVTPSRGVSPARSDQTSCSAVSGSSRKKKLSPQSAEHADGAAPQKRALRNRAPPTDQTMSDVPLVTSASLRDAQGSVESAMSTGSDSVSIDRRLGRLIRKDEQIRTLREQSKCRTLNAAEQAKVDSHASVRLEIDMLRASVETPPAVRVGTSARGSDSARSAAPTMPAAADVAAEVAASASALLKLTPPPTRVGTRQSAIEVQRHARCGFALAWGGWGYREGCRGSSTGFRIHCCSVCSAQVMLKMASDRAAFELTQQALQGRIEAAEQALLALLRNPTANWGASAIWQLAMCEFAVAKIDDSASSPKQLQLLFRAACEEARHPAEVPRLRGSLQIDLLIAAFRRSTILREELHRQLETFKRHYRSVFSGFGRFRCIEPRVESLLSLMRRTHRDALTWRPPGRSPKEQFAVQYKAKGRYVAAWRKETRKMMHDATGKTLSLRGTAGANRAGAQRYLKKVPEAQRPSQEHYTTIRLHQYQAHHIQRSKSLLHSFSRNRCVVQWDEVTLNHLSWSVIILNAQHGSTDLREREVISCTKLRKDEDGASKTGVIVGGAVTTALEESDTPVANIDFCCSDTTSYNSSLKLPRDMGGNGGKGGAYAHMWAWMQAAGHVHARSRTCTRMHTRGYERGYERLHRRQMATC